LKLFRVPEWEFSNVNTLADILQEKFHVTNKWHNDIIYREYLKGQ